MRKVIFFLLFLTNMSYGQYPFSLAFNHLTREGGLSNTNVFSMFKDSRGFLWLGTANGLNKFDGTNCTIYNRYNSGIKGDFIKNIIEDLDENLWIGTELGLAFFNRKTNQFSMVKMPKTLDSKTVNPVCVDNKGIVWCVINDIQNSGLYIFDFKINQFKLVEADVSSSLNSSQNNSHLPVTSLVVSTISEIGFKILSIKNNIVIDRKIVFDGTNNLPKLVHIGEYVTKESDETIWITNTDLGLIKYNPRTNTFINFDKFKENKVFLNRIATYKNYFFIGQNDGIIVFDKSKSEFVQKFTHLPNDLNGLNLGYNENILIDNIGNLFSTQLGVGIDFTNLNNYKFAQWIPYDFAVNKLTALDNKVYSMKSQGDNTWVKMNSGFAGVFDKNGELIKKYKEGLLLIDSKKRVWISDGRKITIVSQDFKSKTFNLPLSSDHESWKLNLVELNNNEYFLSNYTELFKITESKIGLNFEQISVLKDFQIYANKPVFFDKTTNRIIFVSKWFSEVYILEKKEKKWQNIKHPLIPFAIYAIKPSIFKNKVWFCTNYGLVLYDILHFEYKIFDQKDGLPDKVVTDVLFEKNGNFWLVTNKGISHFDSTKKSFVEYFVKDGAVSKEYIWGGNFIRSDGKVFIAGTNGLNVIDTALLSNYSVRPNPQIIKMRLNGKEYMPSMNLNYEKRIKLEANQNSFELEICGIDYAEPNDIQIRYKLEGYENNWNEISNKSVIRYLNVLEGNYILKYQAVGNEGKNASNIKQLIIEIDAPFWRTIWFRSALAIVLLGLAYLLYLLRIRRIRELARQTEEIRRIRAEAEVRALRSQMNPHFIFNCMNTIDSYILNNKKQEASEFLGRFSQLIRRILEHSRQEWVSIREEVKSLELYLSLEKDRCQSHFEYKIKIDEALNTTELLIPTMLLQPFVENAILHGLRHKIDNKGLLSIHFDRELNRILISIDDNGIGQKRSAEINAKKSYNKKSVAMKLTEERIIKLKEEYGNNVDLKIIDKENLDLEGTRIELILPIITD